MVRSHLSAALLIASIALLAPLTHLAHRHADAYRPVHDLQDRMLYLPSGRALSHSTLGASSRGSESTGTTGAG